MLNFNDIKYIRPSYEEIKTDINDLISKLDDSIDYDSFVNICKKIINIQNHIEEMYDYADIRNMRDNTDEFYKDEIEYWNEYKSKYDILFLPFYKKIVNTKYKEKLLECIPANFFSTIECQLKTTSEDIVELQKREAELIGEYKKLSQIKIMYDGEEKTRVFISSYFSDQDRSVRKKAHDAVNDFYYSKRNEYDEILYNLVITRNEIAESLGFANYVEYSLYKLRRFGYNYDDIRNFRDNVRKYIVPLCKTLSDWKKEELGIDKLQYFDTVLFSKMPDLKYNGSELLNNLTKALEDLDDDLANFYKEFLNQGYIDFLQRDNKVNYSITNYLCESGIPAITGNFKNNFNDAASITHELGHAYQKSRASLKDKDFIVSSLLKYPTMEIAEMFSYGMNLITLPYLKEIFNEDDYKKYCFIEMHNLVSLMPYCCVVDEFQERIYSNNNLKVEDIRNTWLELVSKYNLEVQNSGHIGLESGCYFYRQSHIYMDPFYYIDYALSYFGAFILWDKCKDNLDFFREFGSVASYYSFSEFIEKFGLLNPFEEETVEHISKQLKSELLELRIIKKEDK